MWNWNQFKNLPRNRDLSPQEQSRHILYMIAKNALQSRVYTVYTD